MSMKFRTLVILLAGVAIGVSLSLSRGVLADRDPPPNPETLPWEDARLLAEVLERVKQDYVDKVDDHDLMESAIRGMVSALDPHSAFLDSDEYDEIRISTTGNYSGVGIEVTMEDEGVKVVAPIDGTSAAKAGIRPGDMIVAIDGVPVDSSGLNDAINRMRGKAGTNVKVTVKRAGDRDSIRFRAGTIERPGP